MERRFVERDDLSDIARTAFGPGRRVAGVDRLRGGSKKGVYRLTLDDGRTAILYVWNAAENYWPAPVEAHDVFAEASGLDLFEAANARLTALGVRTPRLLTVDASRSRYPADLAIVEDLRGGTLEELLRVDPAAARSVLAELGAALATMHRHRAPRPGKLARIESGGLAPEYSCERIVLDRALGHLADAATRVERISDAREELAAALRELAAAVPARTEYGLIHGELGPDHVLLDDARRPALIDIEGVMFFDVEWEHAFLRMRFRDDYPPLRVEHLDETRLRLYRLALHLSLVAGPLRLLDGDFPDRDFMMKIATFHTERVLDFVR